MAKLAEMSPDELIMAWDEKVGRLSTSQQRVGATLSALKFCVSRRHGMLSGSEEFYLELIHWMEIHSKKNHDYAGATGNPFFNFVDAASFAGISVGQQFDSLIGTKISRLRNLRFAKGEPNNESMNDSYMDLGIYIALRNAFIRKYGTLGIIPEPDIYPMLEM